MMWRFALTLALAVPLVAFAAPASAADEPVPTEHAYLIVDQGCLAKPDMGTFSKTSSLKPVVGSLYPSTKATYRGRAMGGGDETFRWIEVVNGKGCYVPDTYMSSPVDPKRLDPAEFTQSAIVAPSDPGLGVSAVLSAGDLVLRSSPTHLSPDLGEVDEGQVLSTNDLVVTEAGGLLSGERDWRPVNIEGTLGWIIATSLADVPSVEVDSLTSTITPAHDVAIWSLPGAGEQIGAIVAGETSPIGISPTSGWLPVKVDGAVGWVLQSDLLPPDDTTFPGDDERTQPGAEESPDVIVDVQKQIDEWKQKQADKKESAAASPDTKTSWLDAIQQKVSGENPVAEALAKGRLVTAGLIAALAFLLALVGMWGNGKVRRSRAATAPRGLKKYAKWAWKLVVPDWRGAVAQAALPAALAVGTWAAFTAPTHYFGREVVLGSTAIGSLLAWATADRIAAFRRVDSKAVLAQAKADWQPFLLVVAGAGGVTHWGFGTPWSVSILLALVVVGVVVSFRVPHTGEQEGEKPDTTDGDHHPASDHEEVTR